MSKQLALSAAFSIFAMAAFALCTTPSAFDADAGALGAIAVRESIAGAPIEIEAPANLLQLPEIPALQFVAD
ncbi:hypothetical protein SZ64_10650 [Erythrobacter sp. SG61-1L]|uniref:hypothetical protein n=1 Tax=Erythrobacter sp. SG61-1L TaxID=1603897 RepID=UPI0006C93779|nr:hypothetical protein [Erythrobacter sp. SG61-1L]KPL68522.1 hypothetical protein SZ64_10650 [Erythrobacter sp. SG61-1L]